VLRSIQLYNALLRQGSEPGDYDLIRAAGPHGSGAAPLLRIASSLDDAHSEEHNPTTFPTTKAALSSRRAAWSEEEMTFDISYKESGASVSLAAE